MSKWSLFYSGLAFFSLLLCAGTACAADMPPPAAPDAPYLGTDTRLTRLANGLTVLIKEDHRFPIVSTRLYVHAGAAYEKPELAGISHLLEHMVFKGTKRRPKGAISSEVEAAGGYLNAATSFDYTVYITDTPSRHWKNGMDVVGDMAFHALIDPEELASEKEVVIAELKRGKDNPHSVLFEQVQTAALKDTPYARPIIGYENTIRAITAEDMHAYIRQFYQPCNMLLTVVGDVNADEAVAEAERLFGTYSNTTAFQLPQPVNAAALAHAPTVTISQGAWNKVYLAMALPVPGFTDNQSVELDVLTQLLGGDATSLLPRIYKHEKRLVDSISVGNLSLERAGILFISAELDREKLVPFWNTFTADMAKLDASIFSDKELARAKLNLEEDLYRERETVSGLASHLGYFQFFLGGEQGEINMLQAIRNVDRHALADLLQTWITPDRLSTALLEPNAPQHKTSPDSLLAVLNANWPTAKPASTTTAIHAGKTEIVDIGQGRRVVLLPDKSMPHIALELLYSGGDALLSPSDQGLSALTARTLTKGTQQHDNMTLQGYIADRAGGMVAISGKKTFSVRLTGPSKFSTDLLRVFSEVITKPAFAPSEIEREKKAQTAAIRAAEDKPLGLVFRKLPPFLFPGSIFGYETLGTPAGIAGFSQKDVRTFWERQRTHPWVLSVAGDFNREAMLEFARSIPVPSEPLLRVTPPAWGTEKTLNLTLPERNQAHLLLVFPTAPEGSPDSPALDLIQESLGGMGGPLFSRLRDDKGLGYTVSVFNAQNTELGYMVFYIGTDPARLEEARNEFMHILRELGETPLPQKELKRGLTLWEGTYYLGLQSLSSRASEAASLTLNGRPLDFYRKKIQQAEGITPDALRTIAQKYLKVGNAYTVIVRP